MLPAYGELRCWDGLRVQVNPVGLTMRQDDDRADNSHQEIPATTKFTIDHHFDSGRFESAKISNKMVTKCSIRSDCPILFSEMLKKVPPLLFPTRCQIKKNPDEALPWNDMRASRATNYSSACLWLCFVDESVWFFLRDILHPVGSCEPFWAFRTAQIHIDPISKPSTKINLKTSAPHGF